MMGPVREDPVFTSKKTQIKKEAPPPDAEPAASDSNAVVKLKMKVEALEKQINAERVNNKLEIRK